MDTGRPDASAPATKAPPSPAPKPPVIGKPRMSEAEIALFDKVLALGLPRYAEFGIGGSTLLAVRQGFDRMVGIESDAGWVEAVRRHGEIAPAVAAGRARILHADVGPVGAWGSPVGQDSMEFWPRYIARMWSEWEAIGAMPDIVLVDGRFRVPCCLSVAMLAAAGAWKATRPIVLLHDVVPKRPRYTKVLDFFHVEERVESLVVMTPRMLIPPTRILVRLIQTLLDKG